MLPIKNINTSVIIVATPFVI